MFFLVLFRALRNWKLLLVFGIHLFAIGYCYCYCLRLTCSLLWKGGGLDRWHRSRWRRSRPGTWNDTRTRIDKRRRHHCFWHTHTHTQAHKHKHKHTHTSTSTQDKHNLERHQDKNRQEEETPLFLSHTSTSTQAGARIPLLGFDGSKKRRSDLDPTPPPSFLPVIQDKWGPGERR